jgi:hypothetical protein
MKFKCIAKAIQAIQQSIVVDIGIISFILKNGIQGQFWLCGSTILSKKELPQEVKI